MAQLRMPDVDLCTEAALKGFCDAVKYPWGAQVQLFCPESCKNCSQLAMDCFDVLPCNSDVVCPELSPTDCLCVDFFWLPYPIFSLMLVDCSYALSSDRCGCLTGCRKAPCDAGTTCAPCVDTPCPADCECVSVVMLCNFIMLSLCL
jgi:hypothetical protein